MSQIKKIFDDECADLKVNQNFYKKLCLIEAHFVNKNTNHIEFFGGNLTGVQVVRFTTPDRDAFFVDLLEVDEHSLEDQLYSLRKLDNPKELLINQEWHVSSDVFNIASIWALHAVHTSNSLNATQKSEAKIRIALYLLYKYMTSRLGRHFQYPADPEIAQATYAQLSNKFTLKRLGSWGATLRDLAEKAVDEHGIWADVISQMDDDERIVRMMNGIQGSIRDMLKNIYNEFKNCHAKGVRIIRTNNAIETDGETILKDKTKSMLKYTRYLYQVASDKNTFIRQELMDVICSMIPTMNPRHLKESLEWCSKNINYTHDKLVERCIDGVLEHAFEYLSANRELARASKDIPGLLSRLRGAYMSPRSTDPKLLELRQRVGQLVTFATGSKNESAVASARTGFMLYLSLRAWTMQHYSNA